MFILINFGYKCRKIFTIDCLAAAVFDCIWENCYKELSDTYNAKDVLFVKESQGHQVKIEANQKRLEQVIAKMKEEDEAQGAQKKKQQKKGAKKGGKDVAVSPLQQEKIDLEKAIEFSKNAIGKYVEKKAKIVDLKAKLEQVKQKVINQKVYIELVDKTGQRKFIRTKLQQQANTFLSDKGVYYLCTVVPGGQEEQVEALTHDGFALRTCEEDVSTPAEEVFTVKKDDKGKKGGKKK